MPGQQLQRTRSQQAEKVRRHSQTTIRVYSHLLDIAIGAGQWHRRQIRWAAKAEQIKDVSCPHAAVESRSQRANRRLIIIMRYYHDMRLNEIAQVARVSERTVRTRLHAAHERLRIALGG